MIRESFTAQKPSYDRFAKLQTEIESCQESDISINIDINNRFGYTFLFLFSTLPYLADKYNKNLSFYCNEKNFKLLKKLGFLDDKTKYDEKNDYCENIKSNTGLITGEEHIFKIVTEITREAPVKMSQELSDIFISKAGEMYNNALEHSGGVVLGAKYFRNQKNTYCFSCYDTGVGIPANVLNVNDSIESQEEAFRWAMVDGNSTVKSGIPRGIGLGLLKSFVRANDGVIRICSGKVLYTYNKISGEIYHELSNEFHGTLFEMDIIADNERKYILG